MSNNFYAYLFQLVKKKKDFAQKMEEVRVCGTCQDRTGDLMPVKHALWTNWAKDPNIKNTMLLSPLFRRAGNR